MELVEIKVKSIAPYGKGFQVNATIDGQESEITYYGYTKKQALEAARKCINQAVRLPNEPDNRGEYENEDPSGNSYPNPCISIRDYPQHYDYAREYSSYSSNILALTKHSRRNSCAI